MAKKRNFYDDKEVVDHLIKLHVNKMSVWECDFVDSLSSQLDGGRGLTDKQGDRLDELWEVLVVRGER